MTLLTSDFFSIASDFTGILKSPVVKKAFFEIECICMSLFVSTGCGSKSTHIWAPCNHCAQHYTTQQHNEEAHCPVTQRRHCADEKTGTIHGTLCPSAPPEGTDLPKLPVRRTGGPQKNCPQKTGGKKKESKGPWFEGLKRIFQQKYDRWGLCETCVAQAKVLGPMWLMAKVDTLYVFTYDFLSLSFKAELALFVAIFQFVGTEGWPFMFGRMTPDFGNKSRFTHFYLPHVRRAWFASPDHSNVRKFFQILWKSLGRLNWHIRRNAFGTPTRKSFGQTHPALEMASLCQRVSILSDFVRFDSRGIWEIVPYSGPENKWEPNFAGISIVWEFDRFIICRHLDLCDSPA